MCQSRMEDRSDLRARLGRRKGVHGVHPQVPPFPTAHESCFGSSGSSVLTVADITRSAGTMVLPHNDEEPSDRPAPTRRPDPRSQQKHSPQWRTSARLPFCAKSSSLAETAGSATMQQSPS